MPKFAIVGAFCMIIAGAMAAHAANARISWRPAAHSPLVSPFELMLKARNLPVESFDTV